jgi:hypothetical protein
MSLISYSKWISKHAYAKGRACIGLNKKTRPILHGGYPIMAYYNPIILRQYSDQDTLYADKVLLVRRLNWPKIIGKNEVLSKSEGIKLWAFSKDERLYNWSILLSYVHHISSRHLRCTSTVRKYIRYHVAYVTRPHELTFRWTHRKPILDKTSCWH